MALEGTLQDFSLADILQLIGLQKKTGVLTVVGTNDTVTVLFEDGSIVSAESEARHLQDRLGQVLVKSGKLDEGQLARVLQIQKETRRRTGELLLSEEFLTPAELGSALRLQITQIIFRLFRWSAGQYHFDPAPEVEYERSCLSPMPVDNILMEGMRILDEWPLIERRVKSFDEIYLPVDPERLIRAESSEDEDDDWNAGSLDLHVVAASEALPPDNDVLTLPFAEERVYRLLDRRRRVQDLIDASELGEFETCKALYKLLEKDLIREFIPGTADAPEPEKKKARSRSRWVWVDRPLAGLAGLAAAALLLLGPAPASRSPLVAGLAPFPIAELDHALRLSASQSRMSRLEYAVRLYALHRGHYPESLVQLSDMGLVDGSALLDPWGNPYEYLLSRRNYQIRGLDGGLQERADLIVTGRVLPQVGRGAEEGPVALLDGRPGAAGSPSNN